MKKRFLLLSLLVFISFIGYSKSWYVNSLATGNRSGNSWLNALTRLDTALYAAGMGDTIKVAAGTYVPVATGTEYSRSQPFYIRGGIVLLGGYPATGNPGDAMRNATTNPTILSGRIGNGYYSYTILNASYSGAEAVIDGFIVRRNDYGGQNAGGIHIADAVNVVVRNVVFDSIVNNVVTVSRSKASFYNCAFQGNSWSSPSTAINNTDSSTVAVFNSVFVRAGWPVVYNKNAFVKVVNSTVVNSGIVFQGVGTGSGTLQNCIFWNNSMVSNMPDVYKPEGDFAVDARHVFTVNNCITQEYYVQGRGQVLTAQNPMFVNLLNPAGPDNRFFTADDGLQLMAPCSPGLNSGDNNAVAGIATDILGNSRVYGTRADMGAYERQNAPGDRYTTVYVNAGVTGGNNTGNTWQNAFRSLQDALQYCADTIKVAEGTYLTPNSSVDSVFVLANKVVVLGGYPAQGMPGDAQRNPAVYRTLLKGNYKQSPVQVEVALVKATCSDSTSLIDGFEFDNSAVLYSIYKPRSPLYIDLYSKLKVSNCVFTGNNTEAGGGISINRNSAPVITRCSFISNKADYAGAIYCANSSPVISYCTFTDNQAVGTLSDQAIGGAMVFNSSTGVIDSCRFVRNKANAFCTAIYTTGSSLTVSRCYFKSADDKTLLENHKGSNHRISNCTFYRNLDAGFKATIYNNNSAPVFTHCLFDSSKKHIENISNSAPVFTNCLGLNGIFMVSRRSTAVLNNCTLLDLTSSGYNYLIDNRDSSTLKADNVIFWGNRIVPGDSDIHYYSGDKSRVVLRSCFTRQFGIDGVDGNRVGVNPRFVAVRNAYGNDSIPFTEDDGLCLAPCSPAVNTGVNVAGTAEKDAAGMPRIAHGVIDIGAYELQESPMPVKTAYVNAAATGKNNGSSWQDAYTNLQSAVCNTCMDTIRVAAGIYYPSYVTRDSVFLIERKLTLLGGYPAAGNPGDAQRAPLQYSTVLSGDVGKRGDSTDNMKLIMQVAGVKDSVVVDGFTVSDANGSAGAGAGINVSSGGAVNIYYANAVFRNCHFTRNSTTFYGGALGVASRSRAKIRRCIFDGNNAGYGGAIYSACDSLEISESIFENNNVWGYGGAVAFDEKGLLFTWFDIHNCIFYNNNVTRAAYGCYGGAIWAQRAPGAIYNCTFRNNSTQNASMAGGAFYMDENGLSTRLFNNIFSGNKAAGSTNVKGADAVWSYGNVRNNLMQLNYNSTLNMSDTLPAFKDSAYPKGPDNIWFTEDDGLQLAPSSPVIDKGLTDWIGYMPYDALNQKRIVSGAIDLGPYEYQDHPLADAGKDTAVCVGDSIRLGTPGNKKHTYQWTSGPAGFTSSLEQPLVTPAAATTTYYLAVSNGNETAYDTVVVTIASSLTPAVNIVASADSVCAGRVVSFYATGANGGDKASYRWLVNGVDARADSTVFSTSSLVNGNEVKVVLTSSLSCAAPVTATSNGLRVKVLPVYIPSVSIAASGSTICEGTEVTFTAIPVNGGSNPVFSWVKGGLTAGSGSVYKSSSLRNWDQLYVTMKSSEGCVSASEVKSGTQIMNVVSKEAPSVSIAASRNDVCAGTVISFTANAYNTGDKPVYQWYRNNTPVGTGGTTYSSNVFENSDSVFVRLTSSLACVTATTVKSNTQAVTIRPLIVPSVSISGTSTVITGDTVLLTAFAENGGTKPEYQWGDSTSTHDWKEITLATGRTLKYVPQQTGDKIVCIMVSSVTTGCMSDPVAISEAITFKVQERPLSPSHSAAVYPNPVTSILIVDSLRAADEWLTAEIFNAGSGHRVLEHAVAGKSKAEIDVSMLPAGTYILVLRNKSGERYTRKFLKV